MTAAHGRWCAWHSLPLALFSCAVHASTWCVDTSAGIRQALSVAGSNGQPDTIHIVAGTYAPSDGAVAFGYTTDENHALSMEGGYDEGCASKRNVASLTVLSGAGVRQVLRMSSSGSVGAISVTNLTLRDGDADGDGGGLFIGGPSNVFFPPFQGNIRVERVIVRDNHAAGRAGGMALQTRGNSIVARGNVVMFNRCGEDLCALTISSSAASDDPVLTYFGGNTVAFNTCDLGAAQCDSGGARLEGAQSAIVYDNAFAFHPGSDLEIQTPVVDAALYYNNIETLTGTPSTEVGTLSIFNPLFVDPLAYDLRLRSDSPMLDAGHAPYALPEFDVDGHPRIVGSASDLGAYELQDAIFEDGFAEDA